MLRRLRLFIFFVVSAILGYTIGNGPLADWLVDISNLVGVTWNGERVARGPSGTLPLLLAGYLLGQGIYLIVRQFISRIEPMRARRVEELAVWDPSVRLGTRFGLHQYLENCTRWAAEDPTTRMQTLALFKICGLGALNEKEGTLVTTQLLQRIAVELRAAALPESTGYLKRLLSHHFPSPFGRMSGKLPAPRYPARWSGATFALGFRELDGTQACTIARDIAAWIRTELTVWEGRCDLSLVAAVAVGTAGVHGRGLAAAAANGITAGSSNSIAVLVDPADSRSVSIEQMNGVEVRATKMARMNADDAASSDGSSTAQHLVPWFRAWGPGLAFVLGALLTMATTRGKATPAGVFPWPENLTELQIVDAKGPKAIRLQRTPLADHATARWRLSNAYVVQGDPASEFYGGCQVNVTITNRSDSSSYVSLFDFEAVDADGGTWQFDPLRIVRLRDGLTGRWLGPSETWSAWLLLVRGHSPITALRFHPDRYTQIELRAADTQPLTAGK